MTDVHALPTPIVSQAWQEVDTSIDSETPRLLCEEQFERYTSTVAALLEAAGLDVHRRAQDPASLRVCHPRAGYTVELDMREDRSAEWCLEAGDEIPEDTTAVRLAATVAGILNGPPPTALG